MDTERQVNSHEQEGQRQGRQGQGRQGLRLTEQAGLRTHTAQPWPKWKDDVMRARVLRYTLIPAEKAKLAELTALTDQQSLDQIAQQYGIKRRELYRCNSHLRVTNPPAFAALQHRRDLFRARVRTRGQLSTLIAEAKELRDELIQPQSGLTRFRFRRYTQRIAKLVRGQA